MAKNTRKTNGATIPPVAVVVSENNVKGTPLTLGKPVPSNASNEEIMLDFARTNGATSGAGEMGQADFGREIGRWSAMGWLTESQVVPLVLENAKSYATKRGITMPTKVDKSKKANFIACFNVGKIPTIGRAAIDNAHDVAVKLSPPGKPGSIFPNMMHAVRFQRDNVSAVVTVEAVRDHIASKAKPTPEGDAARLKALTDIRSRIDKALNRNQGEDAKALPEQSKAARAALEKFADELRPFIVAVGGGTDAATEKAAAKADRLAKAAAAAAKDLKDLQKRATPAKPTPAAGVK